MAESKREPQQARSRSPAQKGLLPITRDPQFARILADDIIVVRRERDVQVTLIAEGPEPTFQGLPARNDQGFESQPVQYEESFTELGRITFSHGTAFSMAMNIVEGALSAGAVNVSSFRRRFLALLDEYEAVPAGPDRDEAEPG